MSERPTGRPTEDASGAAPWRRFRDLPIWSKLGLIMIVPTLATIVVGTNGLLGHIDTANNADRARVLANLSGISGELVHHLQEERAAAVRLLGAEDEADREELVSVYYDVQTAVDDADQRFQSQSSAITDVPASFRDQLTDIRSQLAVLPQTRNQIDAGTFGLTDSAASYEQLIGGLITMRDSTAQFAGDVDLGNRMRAAASVAQAKELLSQQRVVGHEVLIRGAYHPHLRNSFIGARTGHEQALEGFAAVATDAEQATLDQALEGSDVRQSQLYQDYLDSLDSTRLGDPPWDDEAWDSVMSAHGELLRGVEEDIDSVIVDEAATLRSDVERRVLLETGALLAMLLIAILLAWLVARSMARSLRDLRQGALAVAQHGLPQAVAQLRDPQLASQYSPAQVAGQLAEPLPVRSRDEFGQVAEAFNAVHLEAVRTAAEQAQLRSSVSTMFVNLARRSQILVDRLINHLDRLERGEQDPDRLAELFQLDHLATRMRRNDENLLVLAGADSTRVQREPASLIDVLRAAQSEVEHYTRVDFGIVDRDLEIAPHAVNDLVHLVAELLDNATAFSPPESLVMVEARRVGDRAVLYVEDHGLGMSSDQLTEINDRLAKPPMVDVAVSRMMGLVVVGRLAARHEVTVELRHASERGVIAEVSLPPSVLVPRVPAEQPGSLSRRVPSDPGEQLALEAPSAINRQQPPAPSTRPAPSPGFSYPPPPFSPPPFAEPAGEPEPSSAAPWPAESTSAPRAHSTSHAEPPPAAGRGSSHRSMPAWSDLTGASNHNGSTHDRAAEGSGAVPLPRRRPGSFQSDPEQPPATNDEYPPTIPRPRPDPAHPGGAGSSTDSSTGGPPSSGAPAGPPLPTRQPTGSPPAGPPQPTYQQTTPTDGGTAPPPWPPVTPSSSTPVPTGSAPPAGSPSPGGPDTAPTARSPRQPTPLPQRPRPGQAGAASPGSPGSGGPGSGSYGGGSFGSGAGSGGESAQPPTAARPSSPAPAAAGPAPGQVVQPPPQETMELPIFNELESMWFRSKPAPRRAEPASSGPTGNGPTSSGPTGNGPTSSGPTSSGPTSSGPTSSGPTSSGPTSNGPDRAGSPAPAEHSADTGSAEGPASAGEPVAGARTLGGETIELTTIPGAAAPAGAGAGASANNAAMGDTMRSDFAREDPPASEQPADPGWRTVADDGWLAASHAAEASVQEVTSAGLPKRRPMAQLVPGGVEKPTASAAQRRSPEAVRGLLSAYHRGVQRGREQTTDDESTGSDASQSTQAGKERRA
ncbi:sensor histidine kinase [Natronosporangium hydrolyticum]|uniref:sensor histidine kinase n=1 Tax=Natronosporangium hydrolyticum TaxID=2811111 RepID=UPI001EFA28B2|nr:sensor histidine kinase [Natronosporangium hydrolyticum]